MIADTGGLFAAWIKEETPGNLFVLFHVALKSGRRGCRRRPRRGCRRPRRRRRRRRRIPHPLFLGPASQVAPDLSHGGPTLSQDQSTLDFGALFPSFLCCFLFLTVSFPLPASRRFSSPRQGFAQLAILPILLSLHTSFGFCFLWFQVAM